VVHFEGESQIWRRVIDPLEGYSQCELVVYFNGSLGAFESGWSYDMVQG
jgi:hypothetical protein